MQAKTERFELRLDQETLDRVDTWRARQDDVPTRSEAARRLMDVGLSLGSDSKVRLTHADRLVTRLLCEIHNHLKIKNGIDPSLVEEVIRGGHYWALKWEYQGIFHEHEDSEDVLREVVDVLDMWSFLETGYSKLSKKDKERVEKEAAPFGTSPRFRGFDANNETEHSGIARFLVDKLGRFSAFSGRELNSHCPSIDTYRRMLRVFEPMRKTLIGGELNASQIIEILNAKTHPEHLPAPSKGT